MRTPRTTKLVSVLSLASSVLAFAGSAQAQATATGFVVNRFEPSERGSDWFANESLDLRGAFRPAFGVVADYHAPPLATFGDPQQKVVSGMLAFHAGAALNVADRFRFALSLPMGASVSGNDQLAATPAFRAPSSGGIGDLRFGADLRVGGRYGDPFTVALGMRGWAPTGNERAYMGDGKWRVATNIAIAGDIGPFVYAGKLGYGHRGRTETFEGATFGGNEAFFSVAMGFKVLDKKLVVGPEVFGWTSIEASFEKRTTPLEAIFGLHYAILPILRIGAGVGTGLTNAYGAPDVRGLFGIEVFSEPHDDRDGDGIINDEDACPDVKGEASTDPAKNGCPPDGTPADRDHDGVPDTEDACPDVPGTKTDDPKTNGCPSDKDKDGVYDNEDACVDVPGVKTSDPKTNGCPPDRDNDGIIDAEDACPDEAGLKSSDPKTNGCPDPDLDKDGIPNEVDACPDQPGPADPDPKKNGCPKAFVKAGEIKITDQVKFKTGSAQIENAKDSNDVLQAVFKVLADHPEIKRVRVEGHTDNQGTVAVNKKLSAARAASVVKWLVTQGVDKQRLTSQGFGFDRPIDSNKTPEGRRNNRRVEFHIESTTAASP